VLQVRLLGQIDVRRDGTVVVIPSRAAQSLFAYLLLTAGTAHRREKLAGLLWPDTTDENARKSLRNELWRLRKAIETKTPRKQAIPSLLVDEISIGFDPRSDYWLDVADLLKPLEEPVSADLLIETLSLYRGDLLPGLYDDWVMLERERVRAVFEQKMARLLDLLVEDQRWQQVLTWGERWIALGQTPEPAYRALMVSHGALGNVSQVASVYDRCVQAMANDLGVEPSAQTRSLFERLSRNQKSEYPSAAVGPPSDHRSLELLNVPDSAPVRSPRAPKGNLPVPLTGFIGREKEIVQVKQLLSTTRLLTLTGAGGVGKTRLSLQVGLELLDAFADGVWFVELAPLTDPALVPLTIAAVLGVREEPGQSLMATLREWLRTRQLLLILDNCEHLVQACAKFAEEVLQAARDVRILASSREALDIEGESAYRVPSLSVPDLKEPMDITALEQFAAVRLFVESAARALATFRMDPANAAAIAQVCCRLDGIPLAIELAAARVRVLSVAQIAEHLDDRFNFLTGGSRTALPRQQTLRAAIDWSYAMLSEEEKTLFHRLSVFPASFALDAAEAVCSGASLEKNRVLQVLTNLLDKSFLEKELGAGAARYRLLETIRQYGQMKLQESGETESVRDRHLDFFLACAEEGELHLMGAGQLEWLERLENEHDNIRAALGWSEAQPGKLELGLRIAGALWRFWDIRGYLTEGRVWLTGQLSRTPSSPTPSRVRAKALNAAARLAMYQSDFPMAHSLYNESLSIWRQLDDRRGPVPNDRRAVDQSWGHVPNDPRAVDQSWGHAMALAGLARVAFRQDHNERALELFEESIQLGKALGDAGRWAVASSMLGLGLVESALGDHAHAIELYESSLAICRALGDKVSVAASLKYLAAVTLRLGNYDKALALNEESLELSRELGDQVGIGMSLLQIGDVAYRRKSYDQAEKLYRSTLKLFRDLGVRGSTVLALNHLGEAMLAQGDHAHALKLFRESLELAQKLESKWDIGWSLEGIGGAALLGGPLDRAARLFAAVEEHFESLDVRIEPERRTDHDRKVAALRARLDEREFARLWAEGTALSWQQAVAYASQSKDSQSIEGEKSLGA
jgi:predicted ATPase/DNA-binding SARP family transcriptional activator